MVGSPYCPANLHEISWQDLQWVEMERQAGQVPVQEEIVEDDAEVLSSVIVPDLAPMAEDAMESEEEGSRELVASANN